MRRLKRKIKCSNCKEERIEIVPIEDNEPDWEFDDLICDNCEEELNKKHSKYFFKIYTKKT